MCLSVCPSVSVKIEGGGGGGVYLGNASIIISPKFEHFGDIRFLVAAAAYTLVQAITLSQIHLSNSYSPWPLRSSLHEPYDFWHQSENKMASGRHFV